MDNVIFFPLIFITPTKENDQNDKKDKELN